MALQDLTPQLRTRLNRMERAVGWFVFLATVLLLFGFGYYIYHTAERKGWFKIKAPFFTYVKSSDGLNVGDPVVMMGFPVGQITLIHAMPPGDPHNVRVEFEILDPFFRYIWTGGSYAKINAAGFLNQRQLEVTRATNGYAICVTQPVYEKTIDELKQLAATETNRWQLSQDVFDLVPDRIAGRGREISHRGFQVRMSHQHLHGPQIHAAAQKRRCIRPAKTVKLGIGDSGPRGDYLQHRQELGIGQVIRCTEHQLRLGVPGASAGLNIAERLGLLAEIVAEARAQLTTLMGLNRSTIKALVGELSEAGLVTVLEPSQLQILFRNTKEIVDNMAVQGKKAVALTAPAIRPRFKKLIEQIAPGLTVLSYAEVEQSTELHVESILKLT